MPEPDTIELEVTVREAGIIGSGLECLGNHLSPGNPLVAEIEALHGRIAETVMLGPRGVDDA